MKRFLMICVSLLLTAQVSSCGLIVPIKKTDGGMTASETAKPSETAAASETAATETEEAETTDAPSRVDGIIAQMTLEEKIAQMIILQFDAWTDENGITSALTSMNDGVASVIRDSGIGGVIIMKSNIADAPSAASLISDMQTAAISSKSGIPLLITADQEGGSIVRLTTGTSMPGNMALSATGRTDMAAQSAEIIGRELAAVGINADYAPVLDVNSNPANPIIGLRSFSDDPAAVAEYGKAFISGLDKAGIISTVKHFPGHGDTSVDSHTGLPCINKTLDELMSFELIPFAEAINAGAGMVMTAHIEYPMIESGTYISLSSGEQITLPATLSRTIITGILREKLGFDGVVTTDSMRMAAITSNFSEADAARLAINAGVDMLLSPVLVLKSSDYPHLTEYIGSIAAMVRGGEIAESTIDAAVRRILTLKEQHGILGLVPDKETQMKKAAAVVGSPENHAAEWEIAKAAVTLVKNDGMLPVRLSGGERVLLFCAYENEINSMKYAVSRLKADGIMPPDVHTDIICFRQHSAAEYADLIAQADVIIASSEITSVQSVSAQGAFLDALISTAHSLGKKVAVISFALPYDLARYGDADALLAVYNSEGMDVIPTGATGGKTFGVNIPAGVYMTLSGRLPSGRLPVMIPKLDGEYKPTGEVLYPRGYGLGG